MTDWRAVIAKQPEPWWYTRRLEIAPAYRLLAKAKTGADVNYVQRALAAPLTGVYDEPTEQRVKGLQLAMGLPVTGVVDDQTARAIDYVSAKASG